MLDTASFDSLRPDLRQDPYLVYAAFREQEAVFWSDVENAWVLMRHREVADAFINPQLETPELGQIVGHIGNALGADLGELVRMLNVALFFRNPPAHAALRSFAARLLAFRSQAACAAALENIAERLVAPLVRDGEMDLIRDFAEPLPPLFMGWLYGLSEEESLWLSSTLAGVPGVLDRGRSVTFYRAANKRLAEASAFLRECIARRRQTPGDDLLSMLLSLNGGSATPFNDHDLAALAAFVFMAGFETTSGLLGSGLWMALRDPQLSAQLADDSGRIPDVVEETLRLEPPIQQLRRRAKSDQCIGGCEIRAGEQVVLMIASANRDPRVYREPERFLPGRAGPQVLAFGAGAHHCLGAWIARLEARIALETVLRVGRLRLDLEQPEWWPYHNQRRMKHLPVIRT